MKCHYCHNICHRFIERNFICKSCPCEVKYFFDTNKNDAQLLDIAMKAECAKYIGHINLVFSDKLTIVYYKIINPNTPIIKRFNQLLDITPSNIHNKIKTIINFS